MSGELKVVSCLPLSSKTVCIGLFPRSDEFRRVTLLSRITFFGKNDSVHSETFRAKTAALPWADRPLQRRVDLGDGVRFTS